MRILTRRELNRALLARQLLLERTRVGIPRALEKMGGLQAQYAPSMYIGLWSRLEDFEREKLTRALARRAVVQGTLMRMTIHLVSASDYWPFAVGVRHARRESWGRGPRGRDVSRPAQRLRRRLADGPMEQPEVDEVLGGDPAVRNGVGLYVDLVRVPPSGTWERRRADRYASAEQWLGPSDVTPGEGVDLLVRRYLGGFGPAPQTDMANWAGLPVSEIAAALERLKLRRFRSEAGGELVDLPRAPLPDPETPAPVRFLPTWDATLLAHARRTGILPEEFRSRIFSTKTPHSVQTFLVDGVVAGTWRYERGRVLLEPFARLDRAVRRELDEEAERLVGFHA
jgi:hypothetical protein